MGPGDGRGAPIPSALIADADDPCRWSRPTSGGDGQANVLNRSQAGPRWGEAAGTLRERSERVLVVRAAPPEHERAAYLPANRRASIVDVE
jgi:hypothetical protein